MKQLVLLICGAFLMPALTWGQCSELKRFEKESVAELQENNYHYVRSYKATGVTSGTKGKGAVEYIYTLLLEPDKLYAFEITTNHGNAKGLVVEIHDSAKKMVASNHLQASSYSNMIEYKSKGKGIYYLTLIFKDPSSQCGVVTMGYQYTKKGG